MRIVLISAILVAILCLSQTANACSCAPPPAPKKALDNAAAVFVGKATEVKNAGDKVSGKVSVTFEVNTSYKGVQAKTVVVTTAGNSAACGYGFVKGESYIVYCYSSDKGKTLSTNICTRTCELSQAKEDLDALGDGTAIE